MALAGPIENSQWNQRTRLLQVATGSTELDSSRYVTETLVYAPSVQPTLVQLLQVHLQQPIQVIGIPRTSGLLLDEDFASFTFGDIHASAAQITTRRIIAEPSLLSSPAVSQEQLLQIRVQYEEAELQAKTAEADSEARAALARKSAQQLDLETRDQARRSASSSPRHYSPPATDQQPVIPPQHLRDRQPRIWARFCCIWRLNTVQTTSNARRSDESSSGNAKRTA